MSHIYYKDKRFDKRKMITIVLIIIFIIMLIVGYLFFNHKSSDTMNDDIDTTLLGDATVDPENIDVKDEGTSMNAHDLVAKKDRSNGIDVSKWQGKIDWKKVKEDHIDFAFIRIGYRGENGKIYKDDNADYNIQQAQKNDILVGVYFFSTAVNEDEAREEAKWTMKAIEGYSISYPVVYDYEGYNHPSSRISQLNSMLLTKNALAFLKTIQDGGYDAMFYGSLKDIQDNYIDIDQIASQYKVWIAQYSSQIYPQKDLPDYQGKCHAWQYTNKGSVKGIEGYVDMVVCYFKNSKSKPKNAKAQIKPATVPQTQEEKIYTSVQEKVTPKEEVNLRKSATSKSDFVAKIKNGEVLTRIGVGTNGWSKLKYKNQIVYAISSYLTTDLSYQSTQTIQEDIVEGNTFTAKKDKVTAKDIVNLRALPTSDSELIGTLKSGEFLERIAMSNKGWSRLKYKGKIVYAVTSYLSNEVIQQPSQDEDDIVSDGFVSVNEQVTAKEETNLRSSPTTDSQIIYILKNGEYIKRIGTHTNGWSQLEYNGQIVYAISSYLTK